MIKARTSFRHAEHCQPSPIPFAERCVGSAASFFYRLSAGMLVAVHQRNRIAHLRLRA